MIFNNNTRNKQFHYCHHQHNCQFSFQGHGNCHNNRPPSIPDKQNADTTDFLDDTTQLCALFYEKRVRNSDNRFRQPKKQERRAMRRISNKRDTNRHRHRYRHAITDAISTSDIDTITGAISTSDFDDRFRRSISTIDFSSVFPKIDPPAVPTIELFSSVLFRSALFRQAIATSDRFPYYY